MICGFNVPSFSEKLEIDDIIALNYPISTLQWILQRVANEMDTVFHDSSGEEQESFDWTCEEPSNVEDLARQASGFTSSIKFIESIVNVYSAGEYWKNLFCFAITWSMKNLKNE